MTILETITWVDVCSLDQLTPDRGSCVFVEPYQIALFRLSSDDEVHAISNYDPYSGAYVMSRGIIGSRGDVVKVTSPVYKQAFDLVTGVCLDDVSVGLRVFPVRVEDGRVSVGVP